MSLRTKFVIAFASVAAIVAILVGLLSYQTASRRIDNQVDRSLLSTAGAIAGGATQVVAPPLVSGVHRGDPDHDEAHPMAAQAIAANGTITPIGGRPVQLPVDDPIRTLAATGIAGSQLYQTFSSDRDTYRMLTEGLGDGQGAIQVAIDIDETEHDLTELAIRIAIISAIVVLAAAGAGWLIARRITRRLIGLTQLTEEVTTTGQLTVEVPARGKDEVGRLATSFDAMLGKLASARNDQERLVQDAAHELRTPLTSLRTNARVLRRFDELTPTAREHLLDDVDGETQELTHLVNELVELATQHYEEEEPQPVELAAIAQRVAQRSRRRTGREITVAADNTKILGRATALERAISNLVENAAKFDAGQSPIEINVHDGRVEVLDRGPGIADADLTRVFDRFYRADSARAFPGSGLGLSIVREVARMHRGKVFASGRAGGGATVGFTIGAESFLPDSKPAHSKD
jgi:two-component system sensor histidine kinase MprB